MAILRAVSYFVTEALTSLWRSRMVNAVSIGTISVSLFVLGAADMISVYIRSSLIQLHTPDAMRGRVSAVSGLFISASNELGEFRAGLSGAAFGPVAAVVGGGALAVLVTGLCAWAFPALRKADRFAAPDDLALADMSGKDQPLTELPAAAAGLSTQPAKGTSP